MWVVLIGVLVVDLVFSLARSSLLNPLPVQLRGMRDLDPAGTERILAILEKKRLRVSLRIAMIVMHFILSAVLLLLLLALQPQLSIWLILLIVIVAAVLVLLAEFALEGMALHAPEKWAIRLSWVGNLILTVFAPAAALMMAVLGSSKVMQQRLGPVTDEEIRTWVNTDLGNNMLEKDEREMIYSIFQFENCFKRNIFIHR